MGISERHTIPKNMFMSWLTPASVNDITTAKDKLQYVRDIEIIADKAYCDAKWGEELLKNQNVSLFIPVKLKKGQKDLLPCDKLNNKIISSVRQPIEAFFKWLIDKTNIQSASKVRSSAGLLAFLFIRLASIAFL